MGYEFPTSTGVLRLFRLRRRWIIEFRGRRGGAWRSAEAAAVAAARHQSGLPEWDTTQSEVSDDLLDWRPLGDSV